MTPGFNRTSRIGVTGHRWNRLPVAQADTLIARLADAFSQFPRGPKTLIVGMAEGTDLAACAACPEDWLIEAVLPLEPDRWRATLVAGRVLAPSEPDIFDRVLARARIVVPEPNAVQPAYRAVGRHIAETCDHLVAVWNGLPGLAGGTSEVVGLAQKRGVPVTILWPVSGGA